MASTCWAGFMRPTIKAERCRSGKVEVQHIPNLHIGQAQMHRNDLEPVHRIDYQGITPVCAILRGKCSNAALTSGGVNSRAVYRTTSRPLRFATAPHLLATEPGGNSFSQNGTKSRSAARTTGSMSGIPINATSCPRDASAVIGFRCPANG